MGSIINNQNGFTLVEVLMAILVFSIGVVGLNGLQLRSIKSNADADSMTTMSWKVTDRMEQLQRIAYDTLVDIDKNGNNNGAAGLDNGPDGNSADGSDTATYPGYTVFWNIAEDTPSVGVAQIRVIVVRSRDSKQSQYDSFKADFL